MRWHRDEPLAARTTLGLGGRAAHLAEVSGADDAREALRFAAQNDLPLWVLGGGSNTIVADDGLPGVVLHPVNTDLEVLERREDTVWVAAGAGLGWDALVAWAVAEGHAGVTCLSGIPGLVGAAPIQNIGAYGQELSEVFAWADVMSLETGETARWTPERCAFGYRDSRLKREPGRWLVLRVALALRPGGAATVRYPELRRQLGMAADTGALAPPLDEVRQTVIAIRRTKGMVVDPQDPDSRSAGSFFVNPIVSTTTADVALARLQARHGEVLQMPRYAQGPAADGTARVKLSAAWLIDKSGLGKGLSHPDYGRGRVGLSTKHTLALVNRGAASTADLMAFAAWVQAEVEAASGIRLVPEPVQLG